MRRLIAVFLCFLSIEARAETFLERLGPVTIGDVDEKAPLRVPFIFWGGDVATFIANGGTVTTPNSFFGARYFGKIKPKIHLVPGDDFYQQTRDYLSGKSPFLRGTFTQVCQASEVVNRNPRTKGVMFLQLSWSLGDHMVSRENIKTLNDLKGKKICLQRGGPHWGFLNDSLRAAGLTMNDITVVPVDDLTGSKGPAERFRNDPSIDACMVVTPDMIGLTGGLDQKGSGAEGTVAGSHVVNSTSAMNHSIADVYIVRKDFYQKNRDIVEGIFLGFQKASDDLLKWKKVYNDGKGKSAEYMSALKMAQTIFGAKLLPTLEVDAHGLVADTAFAGISDNQLFFADSENVTGFVIKQSRDLELLKSLGIIEQKFGFEKAEWDYERYARMIGVKYAPPVRATNRIKGEVSDFSKDLDTNTIFSFDIHFEPEQTTFAVESYAAEFKRVVETAQQFGNAVVLIRGHSDPTLALQNFFWAAKAKGLITVQSGNLMFKGKALHLTNTAEVIQAIQSENLAGLSRTNRSGQTVPIDDPRATVAAARQLSQSRAQAVKNSIEAYAKSRNIKIDLSQIQPEGVGIAEPVNARPQNMIQAKENMRVEFRIVRVKAEALGEDDFNFDKQ